MTTLKTVEAQYVQQLWPRVEAFIDAAIQQVPADVRAYDTPHVQQLLVSGAWQLVVAVDEAGNIQGAATISFINYPKHRVAFVTTTGGKFIINQETADQFKAYCRACGATCVQAYCRDVMVRFLRRYGYEPRTTLIEAPL